MPVAVSLLFHDAGPVESNAQDEKERPWNLETGHGFI